MERHHQTNHLAFSDMATTTEIPHFTYKRKRQPLQIQENPKYPVSVDTSACAPSASSSSTVCDQDVCTIYPGSCEQKAPSTSPHPTHSDQGDDGNSDCTDFSGAPSEAALGEEDAAHDEAVGEGQVEDDKCDNPPPVPLPLPPPPPVSRSSSRSSSAHRRSEGAPPPGHKSGYRGNRGGEKLKAAVQAGQWKNRKVKGRAERALRTLVEDAVEDEKARRAGAYDMREEKKTEEQEEAEYAYFDACHGELRALCTFFSDSPVFYMCLVQPAAQGTFFCDAIPLESLAYKNSVSRSLVSLRRPLLPHNVVTVTFEEVECLETPGMSPEIRDIHRLPQQAALNRLYKRPGYVVRFSTSTEPFGYCAQAATEDGSVYGYNSTVTFSLESFLAARQARLAASGIFQVAFQRVQAWRSQRTECAQESYNLGNDSYMSDCVFTSLLLLNEDVPTHSPNFGEAAERLARSVAFKSLGIDRPAAGGSYVEGYDVEFDDIFPGQTEQQIVEGVHDLAGIASRGAQKVVSGARRLAHCVMAPVHVEGIVPTFPKPSSRRNRVIGYTKRLFAKPLGRTPEVRQRLILVATAMMRRHRQECVTTPNDTILEEMRAHARIKRFNETQTEHYMIGGRIALAEMARDADPSMLFPVTYGNTTIGQVEWAMFIKSETYDSSKIKAPRNIIAPQHLFRGYSHALLYDAQKNFFAAYEDRSVKGLTEYERLQRIHDVFEGQINCYETDFTSMESNVTPDFIMLEGMVLAAFAPPHLRARVDGLFGFLCSGQFKIDGPYESITLPPMRMSGTDHTSVGNFIVNHITCFSMFQQLLGWSNEEMFEQVIGNGVRCLFEGDDGLFSFPVALEPDEIQAAAMMAGVRITFAASNDYKCLEFCGSHIRRVCRYAENLKGHVVAEAAARLKDPLDVLARATSIFDFPELAHSARDRLSLQVAKARSYLIQYSELPIVGPVLHAIVTQHSNADYQLRQAIRELREGVPAALRRFKGSVYLMAQRWLDEYRARTMTDADIEGVIRGDVPVIQVDASMREAVRAEYGLSPDAQLDAEFELMKQIQANAQELHCKILQDHYSQRAGARRVTVTKCGDLREETARIGRVEAASRFVPSFSSVVGLFNSLLLYFVLAGTQLRAGTTAARAFLVALWGGVVIALAWIFAVFGPLIFIFALLALLIGVVVHVSAAIWVATGRNAKFGAFVQYLFVVYFLVMIDRKSVV